jgi:hypothetical protein
VTNSWYETKEIQRNFDAFRTCVAGNQALLGPRAEASESRLKCPLSPLIGAANTNNWDSTHSLFPFEILSSSS